MAESLSLSPVWILDKKAVLVHAPESDVAARCKLRISHDQASNQVTLSIRINPVIQDLGNEAQVFMLSVSPKAVNKCTVESNISERVIPAQMLNMLRGVTNSTVVLILTLCLDDCKSSLVLIPSDVTDPLALATEKGTDLHAFARICQATNLRIHFSKQQLADAELHRLRAFARTLRESSLDVVPINDVHSNGGRGVRQRDWTVFHQIVSDPPPYKQTVSTESVLGKHFLDADDLVPAASGSFRSAAHPCSPPSWSPTEVNTPTEITAPCMLTPLPSSIPHLASTTLTWLARAMPM